MSAVVVPSSRVVSEVKRGEPAVCGRALKFSSSNRGLWDTSVSHCSLCLVFTLLLRAGTTSACLATTLGTAAGAAGSVGRDGPLRKAAVRGERAGLVGALGREAFIKLALSQHRAIIAE